MPFVGMDVEVMTKVSSDLKVQADKLDGIVVTVDKLVGRAKGTWHGRDAERLFALWQGPARSVLTNLSADVTGLAGKARSNALEQTQASEDYGSDGGVRADAQRFMSADNAAWGAFGVVNAVVGIEGALGTAGHVTTTAYEYSKGALTFRSSVGAGTNIFDDALEDVPRVGKFLGPADKIFGGVGVGFGVINTGRDFSKGDYVASYLDYAGTALGVAGLIVGMATPVGLGIAVGGLAVAGLSLGWSALPKSFTSAVNADIASGAREVGHVAATAAKDVWNADVAEFRGAAHVAGDVVNVGSKAVDAVANEGSKVLKSILKKPSWAPW